jgi:hypothetical protein
MRRTGLLSHWDNMVQDHFTDSEIAALVAFLKWIAETF